jgi:ABC-type histidine transport system ATPase subunit
LRRFVPVKLVISTDFPVKPDDGEILTTVGEAADEEFVIANAWASVPYFPSVFVTVTAQRPAIAEEGIVARHEMLEAELTSILFPEIVRDVVSLVSLTVAPGRKLVPEILVILTVVPATPVLGVMLLTVGAG